MSKLQEIEKLLHHMEWDLTSQPTVADAMHLIRMAAEVLKEHETRIAAMEPDLQTELLKAAMEGTPGSPK